jgi:hypothetical protein
MGRSKVEKKPDRHFASIQISLIASRINRALSAKAALMLVTSVFHRWPGGKEKAFRTHPGNCALFPLLEEAVESAMVFARESIKQLGIDGTKHIHGWRALTSHRHIISHPGQYKFDHEEVQEFFDNDQHLFDPKMQRLWGVLASLVDWAERNGYEVDDQWRPKLIPFPDIIDAAWTMLRYAMKDPTALGWESVRVKIVESFPTWEEDLQRIYEEESKTGVLQGRRLLSEHPPRKLRSPGEK